MSKYIHMKKVYNLNENFKFPICFVCNNELTPFSITEEEVNKLSWERVERLVETELLKINELDKQKHLIYLCKNCLGEGLIKC